MRNRFFPSLFIASSLSTLRGAAGCSSSSSSSDVAGTCRHLYESSSAYENACSPSAFQNDTEDRFLAECETVLNAPGASSAISAIDQCASAEASLASSCNGALPDVCETSPKGSLADGAACGSDLQCQSGYCKGGGVETTSGSEGGTTATATCGVCAATIAVGQTCVQGDRCVDGATCTSAVSQNGTAGGYACVAIEKSDVGGSCAYPKACKSGLTCDATETCRTRGDAGAACSLASDCKSPLACVGGKCATGLGAGSPCTGSECAPTLTCDFASQKCVAYTFADPGQSCSGNATTLCKIGSCNLGKCPTLIPDGQPCTQPMTDTTCDQGSACIGGKCGIFDPATCK